MVPPTLYVYKFVKSNPSDEYIHVWQIGKKDAEDPKFVDTTGGDGFWLKARPEGPPYETTTLDSLRTGLCEMCPLPVLAQGPTDARNSKCIAASLTLTGAAPVQPSLADWLVLLGMAH